MRLTIVAAAGGIGRDILPQAVAAGHEVTAVVRNPVALADQPVRVVVSDLAAADPAALRRLAGHAGDRPGDVRVADQHPRSRAHTG